MSTPIGDNEIRIIGHPDGPRRKPWWPYAVAAAVLVAVALALLLPVRSARQAVAAVDTVGVQPDDSWLLEGADTTRPGIFHKTVGVDTTLLHIYLPIMLTPELSLGVPDSADEGIALATLAADLRRDNGRIVGAFVLHGEPLSWGLSKRGYCAIIDGQLTLGVADNSPLFEQATEVGGDFFRQYAAVDHGRPVQNNPENSALRRALCVLEGHPCLVCSDDRMTMNDFASTLATLGVQDAIFLVGGEADGWYRGADGHTVKLGRMAIRKNRFLNYLVFRQQ